MERGKDTWQLAHRHANEFLRRFGDRWTRAHRDDLIQDATLAAFRWAGDARDPDRFWAAVQTIARRIRLRGIALSCRERAARQALAVPEGAEATGVPSDTWFSIAGRRVPAHRVLPCLRRALDRLSPLDRQLLLGMHEGFCCAELSVRSSRSEQCVKTRLHRARRRVQKDIEECVRAADGLDS